MQGIRQRKPEAPAPVQASRLRQSLDVLRQTLDAEFERERAARGRTGPWTWEEYEAFQMKYYAAQGAVVLEFYAAEGISPQRAAEVAWYLKKLPEKRPVIDENKNSGYTGATPSPEAAVTPPLRMRDDLDIKAKEAKRLANYQFLAAAVDLENPALALDEQRRRANRLLTAYGRVQEVKRDFTDSHVQLTAARRIQKAAYREGQRAKRQPALRGRPRKLGAT
jgi:hypothetical protein